MIGTPSRPAHAPAGQRPSGVAGAVRNNIVALALLMIALVPLLTGTALLTSAGKLLAFAVLGTALLAVVISQSRLENFGAKFKERVLAGPNLPILLFTLLAALSFAASPYKTFSGMDFIRIGFSALLYFVAVYHLNTRGFQQTITDGLLIVTGLVAVAGLAAMGVEGTSSETVAGTFGTHELLGSFLMLMLPLALAFGLSEQNGSTRQIGAQVAALLAAACLLMTHCRSAWVGSLVSLVTISLLALRFSKIGSAWELRRRKHLIVGPLLILAGAVALFVMVSQTGDSVSHRAGTLAAVGADASFQTRLAMWRGAIQMTAAHPWFGWGVGTYPVQQFNFTHLGNSRTWVLAHGADHYNIAHNFYAQTLAETGIVGLGLYLAALIGFFAVGLRAVPALDNGLRRTLLVGCLAAIAGQAVDAFSSPSYNFASVSMFQWLIMGLGLAAAGLGRASSVSAVTLTPPGGALGISAPVLRGLRGAAAVAASVTLLSLIGNVVNPAFAQSDSYNGTVFELLSTDKKDTGAVIVSSAAPTVTLVATFPDHVKPATGTVFTVLGATTLVSYTTTGNTITLTRTAVRGAGTVTIQADFTDPATTHHYTVRFNVTARP